MNHSTPTVCTCPSGDGSLRHPCQMHDANCVSDAARFDLVAHLERQRYFSAHTFGPGTRAAGIVDHIRKELLEIEADPGDLREWVDVIILALDGAWRSGATAQEIISAIVAKQAKNEARTWPHWSTMPADKAIEHDRSGEMPRSNHAAPGIDLRERIALLRRSEFDMESADPEDPRYDDGHTEALRIADKIVSKVIDASPKGGSTDVPVGFMYRVHLKGRKDGVHWSEVTKEEFEKLATHEGETYWVERATLHAQATSAEVGA